MPTPMIHNETPAAGTNGDGLDFVLLMATPPLTKGKVDALIFETLRFSKPYS